VPIVDPDIEVLIDESIFSYEATCRTDGDVTKSRNAFTTLNSFAASLIASASGDE
jgi:hypothetical protein